MPSSNLPAFQFRGAFTHAELFYLVIEKKISSLELVLLILVDAMVTPRGPGCFATNEYLARSLNAHPIHVSKMIGKMKRAGLLLVTEEDGKRYMECSWSRPVPPEASNTLSKEKEAETQPQTRAEGVSGKAKGRLAGRLTPIYKANKSNISRPKAGVRECVEKPVLGGKKSSLTEAQKFDLKCSAALHQAVAARSKLFRRYSSAHWANEFRHLRRELQDDREGLWDTLQWYCEHMGDKYVPKAYSAASFREKFIQIEDAIERWEEEQGKKFHPVLNPHAPLPDHERW